MTQEVINLFERICHINVADFNVKEYKHKNTYDNTEYESYCVILYPKNPWPENFIELMAYHPDMYILKYLVNTKQFVIYKVDGEKQQVDFGTRDLSIESNTI